MGRKTYFMIDKALEAKEKMKLGELPKHMLYGGLELEEKGEATIQDYTFKNILTKKRGDIVVTNRLKYVVLMRILGIKIILVNMNSNHDLAKKPGVKNSLKYWFNYVHYKSCNALICLSQIQVPKLKEIGAKNVHVIMLGVDKKLIDTIEKSEEYFISSGFDKSKNFNFVKEALDGYPLKILDGSKPLAYTEYLKVLAKAKGVVFFLDLEREDASDLGGTTTSFEALNMGKPVIINDHPWLKELFIDNYYVYHTKDELREIIKKDLEFKKIDYTYLTLDNWTKELVKVIENI